MLAPFWFGTMRVSTGWELLSRALETSPAMSISSCARRRSTWAIVFSTMQYDLDAADCFAEEATALRPRRPTTPSSSGGSASLGPSRPATEPDDDAGSWAARGTSRTSSWPALASALGHVSLADGAASLLARRPRRRRGEPGTALDVFRAEQDHLGLILAVSRLGEAAWRIRDIDLFASTHAELLDLGRSSRSTGVVTGATARLALASLHRGDLDEAQALADRALSSSSDSFMPVVNGYAFKSAGLVNLALGPRRAKARRTCTRRSTHSGGEQEGSALDRQHSAGSKSAGRTAPPARCTTPTSPRPPQSTSR